MRKNINGRLRAKIWERAAVNHYFRKGKLDMKAGVHKIPKPRGYKRR